MEEYKYPETFIRNGKEVRIDDIVIASTEGEFNIEKFIKMLLQPRYLSKL